MKSPHSSDPTDGSWGKTMEEMMRGTTATRAVKSAGGGLRTAHVAHRNGRNVAEAIDPHCRPEYGQDNYGSDHLIAVLSEKVSDDYLTGLRQDGVSYLFVVEDGATYRLHCKHWAERLSRRPSSSRVEAGSMARF